MSSYLVACSTPKLALPSRPFSIRVAERKINKNNTLSTHHKFSSVLAHVILNNYSFPVSLLLTLRFLQFSTLVNDRVHPWAPVPACFGTFVGRYYRPWKHEETPGLLTLDWFCPSDVTSAKCKVCMVTRLLVHVRTFASFSSLPFPSALAFVLFGKDVRFGWRRAAS